MVGTSKVMLGKNQLDQAQCTCIFCFLCEGLCVPVRREQYSAKSVAELGVKRSLEHLSRLTMIKVATIMARCHLA